MLKNIKLQTKMIGSFILTACLSIVIGTVAIVSMNQMNNADARLYEKATVPIGDFVAISSSFHQARILLRDMIRTNDVSAIKNKISELNDLITIVGKNADNVEKTIVMEEDKKTFEDFVSARKQFKEYIDQITALALTRNTLEAYSIIDGPAAAAAHAEQKAIDRLVELKIGVAKDISDKNRTNSRQSASLIVCCMIIGLVVVLVFGIWLVRSITIPLANMAKVARKIAEGDIDQKIEYACKDEIGLVADSFRAMIDSLKNVLNDTQTIVQDAVKGKLDKRADSSKYKGAYKTLLLDINELMNSIAKPIQDVLHSLECLANNDITAKITVQYPGVWDEIKSSVNTTIERIEHIISIVNKVSKGDMKELDSLKKLGKRSHNDEMIPAFVMMMEAIQAISDDINNLAQSAIDGKLDVRVDASKHSGDYQKIITSLNETLNSILVPINEAMVTLEKVAGKDLTVRVNGNYKGDHEKLKASVNTTIDNLDQAFTQVSQATEQVSSASQQISAGSQSLAQGANEQASSLEEVSSSLEEMSSMTKQNAENANQAKNLAGEANNNASQGKQAMAQMSESIRKIKESSDETAKIVKTIDEIAMQTNLLALNAAVEAARAGEAGRGFAVVAEEVRNLAQRSADAAKNTANMIAESVKNSEEGVIIAAEVAKSFDAIAGSNAKVDNLIAEIAAASQEQSQGIDQVNTAVAQMDQVTQQNAANSEESASAAEELSSQAEELQSMVAQFVLSNTTQKNKVKSVAHLDAVTAQKAKPVLEHKIEQHKKNGNGHFGGNGKHLLAHAARELNSKQAIPLEEEVLLKEF